MPVGNILKLAHCRTPSRTANRLLSEFETIGAMLAASPERLLRIVDFDLNAVHAIITFRGAMLYSVRSIVATKPVLSGQQALIEYLFADMAHRSNERVRVLYLNTRNMLVRDNSERGLNRRGGVLCA